MLRQDLQFLFLWIISGLFCNMLELLYKEQTEFTQVLSIQFSWNSNYFNVRSIQQ